MVSKGLSSSQGYAEAQLNVASFYEEGKGVEKDEKEAIDWYKKAAKQGCATAQYFLGKQQNGI